MSLKRRSKSRPRPAAKTAKKTRKPAADPRADLRIKQRTMVLLVVFGILAFLPLIGTLYQLQIREHNYYETMAIANQTRSTPVSASRGAIYDRNMNVLAISATVENVFISPNEIAAQEQDVDLIAEGLAAILGVDADDIRDMAKRTDLYYQVVKKKIDQVLANQVRDFLDTNQIKGVYLETDSQRYYPNSNLASNIIGFVGSDNEGLEGIEAYYNSSLDGVSGRIVTTKGNGGTEMLYNYETYYDASNGDNIVLTLDSTIQYYLEKNLQASIDEYMVQHGAFGIFMDVNTGEVLGMASLGNFDPNNFSAIFDQDVENKLIAQKVALESLSGAAYDEALEEYNRDVSEALYAQWRNRAVSDTYEPGSTFKTVTLAAALEEGAVSLNDVWVCSGETAIKGREEDDPLHCWNAYGHGTQSTGDALANSCNIAFANIGIRLGGDKFYDYVKSFGFLDTTGIDLSGESNSIFFPRETLADPDSYASLAAASFGQTFKITPLQLCRAVAAVVNGGYLLEPYIVSEIVSADGESVYEAEPTVLRQVISKATSDTMCELLINVVENGTATGAQVTGYTIGGKTGTSEKIDEFDEYGELVKDRIVSFVGVIFDEEHNAKYLCLCALDTPSSESGYYISGGVMGTATVRGVFSDVLPYLGFEADSSVSNANVTMPDLTDMTLSQAIEALAEVNLDYESTGDAERITDQIPAPGATIPSGSTALIYLGAEKPASLITVPDVVGCTAEYANDLATSSGLYVKILGSKSIGSSIVATKQSIPGGTQVERGTVIEITFTDTSSHD